MVYSACIFPFLVSVAKLLSTKNGTSLHFKCTLLLGDAGACGFLSAPFCSLPVGGCFGLLCLPLHPCRCQQGRNRDAFRSQSHFCWVISPCQVYRRHLWTPWEQSWAKSNALQEADRQAKGLSLLCLLSLLALCSHSSLLWDMHTIGHCCDNHPRGQGIWGLPVFHTASWWSSLLHCPAKWKVCNGMLQDTIVFSEWIAFPLALILEFALFLGLKEAVQSDSVIAAALGGEANFYCNFSLSMEVLQVTWQKRNGSSFQNIATYSPNYGLRLIGSFQEKARLTRAALKASAITLQNLTFEDESYYRCIFNVFPHGSFSQDIFLNIQSKFFINTFSLPGTEQTPDVVRRWTMHYSLRRVETFHAAASLWWTVSRIATPFLRGGEGK